MLIEWEKPLCRKQSEKYKKKKKKKNEIYMNPKPATVGKVGRLLCLKRI